MKNVFKQATVTAYVSHGEAFAEAKAELINQLKANKPKTLEAYNETRGQFVNMYYAAYDGGPELMSDEYKESDEYKRLAAAARKAWSRIARDAGVEKPASTSSAATAKAKQRATKSGVKPGEKKPGKVRHQADLQDWSKGLAARLQRQEVSSRVIALLRDVMGQDKVDSAE